MTSRCEAAAIVIDIAVLGPIVTLSHAADRFFDQCVPPAEFRNKIIATLIQAAHVGWVFCATRPGSVGLACQLIISGEGPCLLGTSKSFKTVSETKEACLSSDMTRAGDHCYFR